MSFFFGRGKDKGIPQNALFRITQVGEDRLQQEFSGNPNQRILTALQSRGTSNVDELAASAQMNKRKVERLVEGLVRSREIQLVSDSAEQDEL